jgi:putative FmdB family regulatory protein
MYTYRRDDGTTFEIRQKFLDEPLKTCPTTGQGVVRVVQAAGIIFKGSGFYVNDSKSASRSSINTSTSARDQGSDSKSDTKTGEAAKPAPAKIEPRVSPAAAAD